MKKALIGLIVFLGLMAPGLQADQVSDLKESMAKITARLYGSEQEKAIKESMAKATAALYGGEPDPITGQPEAGRSCIEKDLSGKCVEWKVMAVFVPQTQKVINVAERVCTAPADGECEAVVVRGNDRAVCKAFKGASCRARVTLR